MLACLSIMQACASNWPSDLGLRLCICIKSLSVLSCSATAKHRRSKLWVAIVTVQGRQEASATHFMVGLTLKISWGPQKELRISALTAALSDPLAGTLVWGAICLGHYASESEHQSSLKVAYAT